MKVLVCHRNKAVLHMARINAEKHGVEVTVAKNGNEVLMLGRISRPDVIVLGNDLEKPSTDETVKMLKAEPTLRGVEVVITKGLLPDLFGTKKRFPFPWNKSAIS
ncbi:PAS/PAC sensor hybrid histidine kinase [Fimbriimonas ginsengisoli Gsoil 348]|uniref:PAS/PAC sensor hybrid histidine kinase n=2 Tax=Fimbriimonas ginsengisoli TaxID=1005039 RepID=A0A068NNA1_FIMGI|nr:PAS/PAC sensor hybrid histidine kinase [Fimbriimonas ginsengisoli Gsoil 348]